MRRLWIATSLLMIAGVVSPGIGQVEISKPGRQSVYVRDSAVAAEKLALAQRMERLKEWNKSADVYQELIEKFADRVVPTDAPAEGSAARYSSVTLKVQSLIGRWPAEGQQVYRVREQRPAATLLQSAESDDVAALNRVVQRYFPTDAAKSAALRLIELYIESGEFEAAAWLGERLLDAHPGLAGDRPTVLFRTALAQHMAGNEQAAKTDFDELKQQFPAATGTVLGKDAVLADELAKWLAQPSPRSHGMAGDSWPTLGGDATRGRIPDAAGRPAARIASVSLRPRARPIPDAQMRGQIDAFQKQQRELGLSLCVMPAIDRGEIFFQDGTRVRAASVDTGETLASWAMLPPAAVAEPSGRRLPGVIPQIRPAVGQLSVTIADTNVLAILGQGNRLEMVTDQGAVMNTLQSTRLVCVDRASGAMKWSNSPAQFPESLANLRTLSLNGSPLVVGESIYVAARSGRTGQFDDAYVLCFALSDGRLRWACYIASGNAPGENMAMMANLPDAATHIAYAGGRVYAITNVGAVAAIDAYTGTIAWLNLYPRPAQFNNPMTNFAAQQNAAFLQRQRKPWTQNPAIVRDNKVFILPVDSPNVLVYNAASGEELRRIPTDQIENADTLLGIAGDRLVLANQNKVFCINWSQCLPDKPPKESLFWESTMAAPMNDPSVSGDQGKDTIRGRGFVTSDSVFIPTRWNLRRIDLKKGKVAETYPREGPWPAGEGPGNVIVSQDNVIIAGADNVVVYSDLSLARIKLDKAIADAPQDAIPRLKYADTLFAAGETDAAIVKLDEAITLLGGLSSMRPGAERNRVFATALTFAERSADPKVGASDPNRSASLYDRAAAAASSPPQQVTWRLSRARLARATRDFALEVKLYQDILADAKLRGVNVPADDGSGAVMAATIAEADINTRLKDSPAAYAPFERAAKEALAAAKAANDPNQMLAVAQTYPNAQVATDAMFAAAETYEAAGKNRPAVQVLTQLYRKYRTRADKARIIEAQGRNYLALPGCVDVAIGRFTEGAKLENGPQLTRPLKLPDGSTIEGVTFGAAAELLQKYSADLMAAAMPEFNIPIGKVRQKTRPFLPEAPDTVIGDVDSLVVVPRELRRLARFDRVVTWTDAAKGGAGGIGIYAVGTNKPLGVNSTITQQPRGGVWIGNDLLLWSADKVALLRGDTAATAWEVALSALPPTEIVAGDAEMPAPVANEGGARRQRIEIAGGAVIVDNQVVQLRNGRVFMPNGVQFGMQAVAPARRPGGGEEIDQVRPVGDRVLIATSSGRIAAIELANGNVAWQSRLTDAPLQQVVASDDFLAARFTDDFGVQIVALETFTGQVVWRRAFAAETGQIPINMIFSPDGTLLFTLPDRLCGMDLYEPGKALKFGDDRTNFEPTGVFAGASGPDQLVVAQGRVLALSDGGQFVRVLSPDDGQAIPRMQPLSTGANNWNVSVRVAGPMVYVINPRGVQGFNLDRPDESWDGYGAFDPQKPAANMRDAFIGKRHLVLLAQPTDLGAEATQIAPRFRLEAYARYRRSEAKPGESGKIDQTPDVTHPAGIDRDEWQAVDGGFYFRSADRQAHFLKGAGAEG